MSDFSSSAPKLARSLAYSAACMATGPDFTWALAAFSIWMLLSVMACASAFLPSRHATTACCWRAAATTATASTSTFSSREATASALPATVRTTSGRLAACTLRSCSTARYESEAETACVVPAAPASTESWTTMRWVSPAKSAPTGSFTTPVSPSCSMP